MSDESKPNAAPSETQAAAEPSTEAKVPSPNSPPSPSPTEAKAPAAAGTKPALPSVATPKPSVPAKPAGPVPVPWEDDFIRGLKKVHGSGIRETCSYLGQNYITVDSSLIIEVLRDYREDEAFDYLVDLTAVHYPKREKAEFDVVYVLYSFAKNTRVRVKTRVADGEALPSVVEIWPTANWLEREVFDMFGIRFEGHPALKRILLPEDWKGHPLRKEQGIAQQDTEWVRNNVGIESAQ